MAGLHALRPRRDEMRGTSGHAGHAAVLIGAMLVILAGSLPVGAAAQGTAGDAVQKGTAACRALRDAGMMRADQSAPEGTAYHQLGPGWQGKHPRQQPRIEGVYGVGGIVAESAADIRTQWWLGIFPSPADAKADMEDHRLWPPKLERSAVDGDFDEAYTSLDTSTGQLSSESGGEAVMPGLPYVEGRFRCGRLVVYLLWQQTPRSPVPPGDARVSWARGAYPTMRSDGRGHVVELARGLHQRLIRERACWCTSKSPEARAEPRLTLELANVLQSVPLGGAITGVATVALRGITGSTPISITAALVQGGIERSVGRAAVTAASGQPRKLALSRDLSLAAGGEAKAGPAEVVVTAVVAYGGEARSVSRRTPIRVLPAVRKMQIDSCAVFGSGRVGQRTRIGLTFRLTNRTKSPLRALVTDRITVWGPRTHSFEPTSRPVVVPAGDVYTVTSPYPVTFAQAGTYTVDYRVECSFAQTRAGQGVVKVTEAAPDLTTGRALPETRKATERSDADAAAARSKHSSARFLLMSGKAAEAEAALRDVVRLDPSNDAYWETLHLACAQQEKWPEAEAAIRKAATLKPGKWEHHNNLAIVLNQQGKRDEAIAEARTALKLGMPKDAFIVRTLGIAP